MVVEMRRTVMELEVNFIFVSTENLQKLLMGILYLCSVI
jgi:hypothetical protein